jgi:hypothetical protein
MANTKIGKVTGEDRLASAVGQLPGRQLSGTIAPYNPNLPPMGATSRKEFDSSTFIPQMGDAIREGKEAGINEWANRIGDVRRGLAGTAKGLVQTAISDPMAIIHMGSKLIRDPKRAGAEIADSIDPRLRDTYNNLEPTFQRAGAAIKRGASALGDKIKSFAANRRAAREAKASLPAPTQPVRQPVRQQSAGQVLAAPVEPRRQVEAPVVAQRAQNRRKPRVDAQTDRPTLEFDRGEEPSNLPGGRNRQRMDVPIPPRPDRAGIGEEGYLRTLPERTYAGSNPSPRGMGPNMPSDESGTYRLEPIGNSRYFPKGTYRVVSEDPTLNGNIVLPNGMMIDQEQLRQSFNETPTDEARVAKVAAAMQRTPSMPLSSDSNQPSLAQILSQYDPVNAGREPTPRPSAAEYTRNPGKAGSVSRVARALEGREPLTERERQIALGERDEVTGSRIRPPLPLHGEGAAPDLRYRNQQGELAEPPRQDFYEAPRKGAVERVGNALAGAGNAVVSTAANAVRPIATGAVDLAKAAHEALSDIPVDTDF